MGTLHCALENGADLYVNERQYDTIALGLLKKEEEELEERRMPNQPIFFSRGAYVNYTIMAMLYTHSIGNQSSKTMALFKMLDSVPSARYSSVCNVLRLWRISLIPTYKVY